MVVFFINKYLSEKCEVNEASYLELYEKALNFVLIFYMNAHFHLTHLIFYIIITPIRTFLSHFILSTPTQEKTLNEQLGLITQSYYNTNSITHDFSNSPVRFNYQSRTKLGILLWYFQLIWIVISRDLRDGKIVEAILRLLYFQISLNVL